MAVVAMGSLWAGLLVKSAKLPGLGMVGMVVVFVGALGMVGMVVVLVGVGDTGHTISQSPAELARAAAISPQKSPLENSLRSITILGFFCGWGWEVGDEDEGEVLVMGG